MRGKIIFVVGLATGYVLGTRAGRERYEQIKAGAEKVWNTPTVQSGVQKVQEFAGARVDTVKADLSHKARNALGALIGRDPLTGPQQSAAASTAGSTRPKPAAAAAGTAGTSKPAARNSATTKPSSSKSSSTSKAAAPSADVADSDE
ncbi:YtxH domain-containing protein [Herbiconiux sp. P16]|uniref:YtxH domain-containing protein n=1 Tax=Herbiconiux wuyangfengii TaxID=3342794 RepID=UPI0035B7FD24